MEYLIQAHRCGEFSESANVAERLYRIGGYMSTYGSSQAISYLNRARSEFSKHVKRRKSGKEEFDEQRFCVMSSLLAVLLMQSKKDIFGNKECKDIYEGIYWLNTRLPISLFNKYKEQLEVTIQGILASENL